MEIVKIKASPKSILIPTDFSDCANNACAYASSLLDNDKTTFKLINTFRSEGKSADDYSQEHDNHKAQLSNAKEMLTGKISGGSKVEEILIHGDIAYLPEQMVKENDIDLIIMGSEGACKEENCDTDSYGEGYSNTSKLLSRLDRNFLIIPSDCEYQSIRTVLFATDLRTELDEDHVNLLNWLIDKFSTQIHYGYITNDIMSADQIQENYIQTINKQLNVKAANYHEIRNEAIITGINKLSNSIGADMIIAVSHQRNFIERLTKHSYTKDMAEKLHKPLLILSK